MYRQCPYCKEVMSFNVDKMEDGDEKKKDCSFCKKTFIYKVEISFGIYIRKADCLNGGEHKWTPFNGRPESGDKRMFCLACDETKEVL